MACRFSFLSDSCKDEKEHTVEILFDVDMEWLLGRSKVDSWCEQNWRLPSPTVYI